MYRASLTTTSGRGEKWWDENCSKAENDNTGSIIGCSGFEMSCASRESDSDIDILEVCSVISTSTFPCKVMASHVCDFKATCSSWNPDFDFWTSYQSTAARDPPRGCARAQTESSTEETRRYEQIEAQLSSFVVPAPRVLFSKLLHWNRCDLRFLYG